MAWDHLSVTKPHLVYLILGGFTSIFMLVSLFIKEKLYIGEATVATICGVIFGPHAANLINPLSWGNTDLITLEFSRIVLVVQCFAVGVELPKAYMERHWKSVVLLLVPVMTFGWIITSLFIWWLIEPLTWLDSLIVAACVTATDPVLASSVVGKGKFAKRVPKHLRDLLSAESGCNDGMAFPFIYLSVYLLRYHLDAAEVTYHWFCYTVLYECIFGAVYGVVIGYIGRHAIKLAERKGIIDRESFLVFYFVLALFCAGSGSLLGMDDLLVGFAAGVGFSNDGWFTEKTEESHVSNVIDLLINLSYFVYFGTIIPWDQYNSPEQGMVPWRLVVISILVLFFRRIPIMLALKPFIPDVKTWREAMFAGHFGPIGVGAIFIAILARAELETESTIPLAVLPPLGTGNYDVMYLVWPITTFLVTASIIVHGSSIAVFTLGRRINTLQLTLSYTTDNEKGPAWMNRLPRISSGSRSMSRMSSFSDADEKLDIPPGQLPPAGGLPKLMLRRQKEEDYDEVPGLHTVSKPHRRKKKDRGPGDRPGGPVSASAIHPAGRSLPSLSRPESGTDTLFEKSAGTSSETKLSGSRSLDSSRTEDEGSRSRSLSPSHQERAEVNAYDEGTDIVVEDKEGNVLDTADASNMTAEEKATVVEKARRRLERDKSGEYTKHKGEPHPKDDGEELKADFEQIAEQPQKKLARFNFNQWKGFGRGQSEDGGAGEGSKKSKPEPPKRKRGPAHAYQFGNTIIVEDEDGEVIKEFKIPGPESGEPRRNYGQAQLRQGMRRMSTWVGLGKDSSTQQEEGAAEDGVSGNAPTNLDYQEGETLEQAVTRHMRQGPRDDLEGGVQDDGLRMTISRAEHYGLTGLQRNPEDRQGRPIALASGRRLSTAQLFKELSSLDTKKQLREIDGSDAPDDLKRQLKVSARAQQDGLEGPRGFKETTAAGTPGPTTLRPPASRSFSGRPRSPGTDDYFSPVHRPQAQRGDTSESINTIDEEEIPTHDVQSSLVRHGKGRTAADARRQRLTTITSNDEDEDDLEGDEEMETAAEKRRRLAALGFGGGGDDDSSDSEDNDEPRRPREGAQGPGEMEVGAAANRGLRVQWGGERGRERASSKGEKDQGEHTGRKVRGMFKNRA